MFRASVGFALFCLSGALHAQPSTDQILTKMGFSAVEKRRVLDGDFVTTKIGAVSERDLSFSVAFLVKISPQALSEQVLAGAHVADDGQVRAYGLLSGPGSLTDFSELRITEDEARALSQSEPGDDSNYSAGELALFNALRGKAMQAVQEQLRQVLLARYQSYRASGLGGIAPYARDGGRVSDVASDLTKAVRSMTALQEHMPELHRVLLDYPRAKSPEIRQSFRWVKSIIRGRPTYALAHVLAASDGDVRAVVRREFYVSAGYNAQQVVAGFLPVAGGTVVLYMSHAFTDQVTGAGGSLKRTIGSRVMADQLKEIFENSRKRIER